MIKKVQIIKCSNDNFWYRDLIGKEIIIDTRKTKRWDDSKHKPSRAYKVIELNWHIFKKDVKSIKKIRKEKLQRLNNL